jgi:hypothetical protein
MMKIRCLILLGTAMALLAADALAVIAVKLPVSQMYDGARTVIVGNVTKLNPQTGAVTASAKALKGATGDVLRFKLEGFPAVVARLKEGSPFVLLTGTHPEDFALHLGDTWFLPEAKAEGLYLVKQERDLKQSYPGTTAALMKIAQDRAAKKYNMLDQVTEQEGKSMLHGGVKDLGKFDAAPFTSLQTIKALRGNRKSLIALGKDSMKFFAASDQGITPARPSLPAIPVADVIAVSVVDLTGTGAPVVVALKKTGQLDLYQTPGNTTATKTIHLWKDNTTASAAAFGNFGEDEKPCVIVIKDDNIERYSLDASSQPADFLRLTGERVSTYHKDKPNWLSGATAAPVDINGDGKTDVLINTIAGPMLLINRGYGAFFIDQDVAKILKTEAGQPLITEKSLWTAIDVDGDHLDDLLIINESGAAIAVMNVKAEKKE